ncbi:hypothetical protein [Streptomyces nigrescens]|uniref:hypothetical protein n=1 Tax=Streptomyces nigrescens TaxID=1920 RepID=UPI0036F5EB31
MNDVHSISPRPTLEFRVETLHEKYLLKPVRHHPSATRFGPDASRRVGPHQGLWGATIAKPACQNGELAMWPATAAPLPEGPEERTEPGGIYRQTVSALWTRSVFPTLMQIESRGPAKKVLCRCPYGVEELLNYLHLQVGLVAVR